MVKRVKDPEDQEVVPVKWYQRRRCTDDTCAIASCCSGSREEITIVASVKDTEELPKSLKQIVKAKLQAKAVQAKRQANVKQNVKAAVPKLFKAPAKKYQRRRCPDTCTRAGKETRYCLKHGGSKLCPVGCARAGGRREVCPEHGGSAKCPAGCANAGKMKSHCAEHGGYALCPASCPTKYKVLCAEHGGSRLCVCCKMTIVQKMGDYCGTCVPVASFQSRVREARMAATLQTWNSRGHIPEVTRWNKGNPMAERTQCGGFRPDFVTETELGVWILEFDEEMHRSYPKRCELERMVRVTLGYGGLSVFWIRFNPDEFKVDGKTFPTSREVREEVLLKVLKDAMGYADYDHFMTICYLFYDKPENTQDNYVQKFQFKTTQEYLEWIDLKAPEDVVAD